MQTATFRVWRGEGTKGEFRDYTTEAIKLEEDLSKLGSVCDDMDYAGRVAIASRKSQLAARLGELSDLINMNRVTKASL